MVQTSSTCVVAGLRAPICLSPSLSGIKLDRRLLWKPPDMEWVEQCHFSIICVKDNKVSVVLCSPNIEMVFMPPTCCHGLLGLKPDKKLHRKPPNLEEIAPCAVDAVKLGNNRMSRHCLSGAKTALTLFDPKLLVTGPLGLTDGGRLHWEPPGPREVGQHPIDVVKLCL